MSLFSRRHDQEQPYEPRDPFPPDEYDATERKIIAECAPPVVASWLLTYWDICELDMTLTHRVAWGAYGFTDFENVDEAWEFALRLSPGLHPSPPFPIPCGARR